VIRVHGKRGRIDREESGKEKVYGVMIVKSGVREPLPPLFVLFLLFFVGGWESESTNLL
jgi:hypothetical protein